MSCMENQPLPLGVPWFSSNVTPPCSRPLHSVNLQRKQNCNLNSPSRHRSFPLQCRAGMANQWELMWSKTRRPASAESHDPNQNVYFEFESNLNPSSRSKIHLQIRAEMPCQWEPAWAEMWALVHSECLLEDRLLKLAHQLSDANLAQMPEFHQRVQVLKRLEYIAPDTTVQMKVWPHLLANIGQDCPMRFPCL